jgi:outer membrane protein OmpA-like peptidoglycan-associated protein
MGLNKMMMKRIICIIILACLVPQLFAQISQGKKLSTLVFHSFYNDFKTAQFMRTTSLQNVLDKGQWSEIGDMQMGFGFNYLKGISKKIDAIITIDGSSTDYLFKNGSTNGSSKFLLDASTALNIKLLTDSHTLVPYFSIGAGLSSYNGKTGFYIPAGAGIQFNLFNEAFVLTNIQYRPALTSSVNDHFYYSIGIGTNIGKKKIKAVKVVEVTVLPEPVKKEIIIPSRDIVIIVMDEATGQPLPYVEVVLNGPEGKRLSGSTDADGRVTFNKLTPEDYTVRGLLNNINTSMQNIKKGDFEANDNQINITITHNDPRYTLSGLVINKTKNIPEGGVEVNVTNETKHSIIAKQSNAGDGIFSAQLEAGSDFTLVGKKADYISNIERISTKGLNRSTILYVKLELGIEEAKVGQSIVLNNIYFEVGKANLNTSFSSDLDKLIQFLKDNPETRLEIQGHTDNTGSLNLNNKLSQSRANSVVDYLTKNGIGRSQLIAKGYGPSLPVADNARAEGRTKNRRVVMKVIQ